LTYTDGFDNREGNPPEETKSAQKREALQLYWVREIGRYERQFKSFESTGNKILKLYRQQQELKVQRKFAMLWANTDVLKPSVYARVPVPIVSRRWKDKDPVGLLASELIERNLSYEIEQSKFHDVMQMCRDDMLLPGRGTLWVRDEKRDGYDAIAFDFVSWKDFGHTLARTWPEVTAVWRKTYLTKRQLAKEFFDGDMESDRLREIELDHRSENSSSEDANPALTAGQSKATVYEIWDKKSKKIIHIAKGATYPLDIATPALDLKSFWPCPKPLYATLATESLEPTPDYKYYQDQAEEIDVLTGRIAALSDALKLVGFYPSGENESDIAMALSPGFENRMIAIDNWAAFAEKGGTAGVVFLPIKDVVETITACIQLRTQLIQDVFQIMGLSDIQRGASNPDETLGAQQLKAQYGSNRLKSKRDEIARFAQEALEIAGEIIAENFDPKQVLSVANRDASDPQLAKAAFALLRDDHLRCFRIDIETDSTIYPDENAEKQTRNEFLGAVAQFFQQAAPMVQAVPSAMPLVQELLMFVIRGHRVARELEGVIDQTMQQMQQDLQQQQQQGNQNPAEMAKIENDKQRIAIEDKKVTGGLAIERLKLKHEVIQGSNQTRLAKDQQVHQQGMEQDQFDAQQGEQMFQRGIQEQQAFGEEDAMAVKNPAGGPIAQALAEMTQALLQLQQVQVQQNQQMMQLLAAPKHSRIVRHPETGDVIGAEQIVAPPPSGAIN
jgi:hypothetical protein